MFPRTTSSLDCTYRPPAVSRSCSVADQAGPLDLPAIRQPLRRPQVVHHLQGDLKSPSVPHCHRQRGVIEKSGSPQVPLDQRARRREDVLLLRRQKLAGAPLRTSGGLTQGLTSTPPPPVARRRTPPVGPPHPATPKPRRTSVHRSTDSPSPAICGHPPSPAAAARPASRSPAPRPSPVEVRSTNACVPPVHISQVPLASKHH